MNRIIGALFSVLLLGMTGCAYLQSYVEMAKDKGLSNAYQDSLNTWTRAKTVHSQFETKVTITATLKSQPFNRAYLKEYERVSQLSPPEKKKWEETQAGLAADFTEFLFYAYVPDKEANDFDKRSSLWTIFIIDDRGKRVEPVEIRRIDKITTAMETFYPYLNKYYGNFYSLKFKPLPGLDAEPRDPSGKPIRLVMTSVVARVELTW
jgi:hypothetical protein